MVFDAKDAASGQGARASWIDFGLFILIAIFMLWGIGSYGLYEPHEAQYGGGGYEMVRRGDWVTTYINGGPELNKPPLFYWLIATSFLLLSKLGLQPEFVARFPLALVALSAAFIAWQWARELWGVRAGRFAALMLAVSSGWYIFAHQLMTDELLSLLILFSLYVLWIAIRSREAAWPWILFYATIGLAMLAKGLLGIVFPCAIFGAFILVRRDWSLILRARPLLGLLVVACVVVPWAYLFESHNPGALRYMIVNEHFKRIFDRREPHDYGGVQVSIGMFGLFVLIWTSPWSLIFPQVAAFAWRGATANSGLAARTSDAVLLLSLGALLPVLFFLPIPSRLLYYSMPAVPPFAILCAGFWNGPQNWSEVKRILAAAILALIGSICFVAAYLLPKILSGMPDLEITPGLSKAIPAEAMAAGAVLLGCGALLYFRRERCALVIMVGLMGALEIFNVGEFANFDPIMSSKKMVAALAPVVGSECVWISEGSDEVGAAAGTAFYLQQYTADKDASVLIMDVDPRRPMPVYPGKELSFFIGRQKLDELWKSNAPVLYVTDYKRTDWNADKPTLPTGELNLLTLPAAGHRRVYANAVAWKRISGKAAVPAP